MKKNCEYCGAALARKAGEVPSAWQRRRYCDLSCRARGATRKGLAVKLSRFTVEGDCRLWSGAVNKDGYGNLRHEGLTVLAHRAAYEHHIGPIPQGLQVCHRCDNPGCINPAHLFLGSQIDNIADMVAKGRQRSLVGTQSPNAKLSEEVIPAIISDPRHHYVIAAEYGVTRAAISAVKRGERWRHARA